MKVVLVANKLGQPTKVIGSVYSSETARWSDVSTTDSAGRYSPSQFFAGNTIHWLVFGGGEEIQFDLDTHRLAWIKIQNDAGTSRLIHLEDGGVGLASLLFSNGVNSRVI
jgi:hypothetical protein